MDFLMIVIAYIAGFIFGIFVIGLISANGDNKDDEK